MKSLINKETETLDDLLCGYEIFQPKDGFRFSIDAVLLAHFAKVKSTDIVVDFCSGSGVVAFLINAHKKPSKITCVEIQALYYKLINKSIAYNNLKDSIYSVHDDILNSKDIFGYESVDVVTCNPPYLKNDTGKLSIDDSSNIAKREVKMDLSGAVKAANVILKNKGRFTMVHLANRADEIFKIMNKYNMPVKRARLVQPNSNTRPNLILVEAVKNASKGIDWLPTLNVYTEGKYSKEIEDIYEIN